MINIELQTYFETSAYLLDKPQIVLMDNSEIWYEIQDLIDMKWNDTFCCIKCGSDNYRIVKDYGRRCKDCGREESLFKYTAFERMKLPFDKIQILLLAIEEATDRIINGYIIHPRQQNKEPLVPKNYKSWTVMGYNSYTLNKEYKRYQEYLKKNEGKTDKEPFKEYDYESIILRAINKVRPTISELARLIDVEENTVTLLLKKINDRIPLDEIEECDTHYLRLELYFDYNGKGAYSSLMSLLMLPLIGEWENGTFIHDNNITINEWKGKWGYSNNEDYFEYGDKIWKNYFVDIK